MSNIDLVKKAARDRREREATGEEEAEVEAPAKAEEKKATK